MKYTPKHVAKFIDGNIKRYFNPQKLGGRYWISCNYYSPNNGYNFYFNFRRPHNWQRSWPLADCKDCSIEECIEIIRCLRTDYNWQFTIEYRDFDKDNLWLVGKELGRLK